MKTWEETFPVSPEDYENYPLTRDQENEIASTGFELSAKQRSETAARQQRAFVYKNKLLANTGMTDSEATEHTIGLMREYYKQRS
ncbi:MAG: hypothetical protein KC877_00530 [Candidatus Kaiserbacteria bacterium]|nr:hypothetical protein [Candidatus Kaiserbacteria bacterium]MCB9816037.1 hypothetical protein [Candidatus Nomurabacteria bacterium]